MNIFIVCGNLRAGGAERVVSILCNRFVKLGIHVELFTWYETDIFYTFNKQVKISQIPLVSGKANFIGQMMWFRKKTLELSPDVVLSFLAPFNILTVFSLLGIKIPVLVAERNDPYFVSPKFNLFWKVIRNIAYYLSDGILVQTSINKSHFPSYLQTKATIIYNPVNLDPQKIGSAIRSVKKKEIVSVTRLEKQKNVDMLIDAFYIFQKNHPDYVLTIYGEGNERNNLEKKIESLNMTDCISLPGRRQNVHDHIINADFFAMASNFEGMSNSLIEAMCLGLPCISTKVSGATDLIDNHVNGILVDVGDTCGMAKAMAELADNDSLKYNCSTEAIKLSKLLNVERISAEWLNYINLYVKS